MMESQSTEAKGPPQEQNCLVRSMLAAFKVEPSLEAVTVNRAHRTISVATLGKSDDARLNEQITTTVREAQAAAVGRRCGLLDGSTDCTTCDQPLSSLERRAITIKKEGDATTIARVTCPTAPRFWRWRDIPWPKVIQRDVEFLESAAHADEW